jgi:hypothetical protein
MGDDRFNALFQRIRTHCQERGWYGRDDDVPVDHAGFEEPGPFDQDWHGPAWYDEDGHILAVYKTNPDPRRTGFAHPPATEEQLRLTEETLGFSLPPALRALYGQLANGGFGPGDGIIGAIGGYANEVDVHYKDITDGYHARPEVHYVDLAVFEQDFASQQQVILPHHIEPDYLLPLCYGGCGIVEYIHAPRSQIVATEGISSEEYVMYRLSPSFEERLEEWLKVSTYGPKWTRPSHE